ncbi:MAG: helix-turn-helix domain-containing protein [Parachlamydiaceae bacterium]|nr:helix-turn-helix domain-containing protein [Parachlamydiaceae bacterium]
MPTSSLFSLHNKLKTTKDFKEKIRIFAILAQANGHSIKSISSILRISKSTVYEYINEFKDKNKTTDKNHPGRGCKLSNHQENELIAYIKENSYKSVNQLCLYVKTKYDLNYTIPGLSCWLKRNNLQKKHGVKKRK